MPSPDILGSVPRFESFEIKKVRKQFQKIKEKQKDVTRNMKTMFESIDENFLAKTEA